MPIKHHFGKSEWLKINQQRPQLVPHVYREAYTSLLTILQRARLKTIEL